MRILLTCWPAYGHLLPLLPLAAAARRAGHDVVIASGAEVLGEIARHGFTAWEVGWSRAEGDARFRAEHPELAQRSESKRLTAAITGMFVPAAGPRAEDVLRRTRDWLPDLVVHEISEPGGALVAAATGARSVVHSLGLLPPGVLELFLPGFVELADGLGVPDAAERLLASTYLDIAPPALQPDGPSGFTRIQPLRPSAGVLPRGARWPALDDLPYVDTAYLTLGTIFHGQPDVFAAAVAGLRQLSVNVVVTLGPGARVDALGAQPANVRVLDYVPQALLLPRCRLVVSHGGAGTVLGSLSHGLPQLVLPQGADNGLNAAAVTAAGCGLALAPQAVTPSAVRAAAERLLDEPRFTAAAWGIRTEITAMPDEDSVLPSLTHTRALQRTAR